MDLNIKNLNKIEDREYDKVYDLVKESFKNYEKLVGAFPDWDDRQAAIEMVLSFYLAYDWKYGAAYSLDEEMKEVLVVCHSDVMDYSEDKILAAECENDRFRAASARLSDEQVEFWNEFFDELDRQERKLEIPRPHIYVDFLAVKEGFKGEGRGSRIIGKLKEYADETGLPIMLFTNGEDDVRFYKRNGFRILAVTESEKYKFENTYMLYEPEVKAQA